MPFLGEPFDENHPRCRFPAEGKRFSEVMELTGKRPPEIANAVGIVVEQVRAYRRGFARPGTVSKQKLERFFGYSLDPQSAQPSPAPTLPVSITLPSQVTLKRDEAGDIFLCIHLDLNTVVDFATL